MSFWTYMIQCADRSFYVGHTDDLAVRLAQHEAGTFKGYTSMRRPVHLVWSEVLPTRDEALAAERMIKGWRREKKLALIRGDWEAISVLSHTAKGEGRASTSSARTAPRVERTASMQVLGPVFLHPHSTRIPSEPFSLEVQIGVGIGRIRTRFRLVGDMTLLSIPPRGESVRRDLLWQHSCFEVFVGTGDGSYLEYNLSPSTEWAAYRFIGYRDGMAALDTAAPGISVSRKKHALELTADLTLPAEFVPDRIGLSAVLEEHSGAKSYWALAHPAGDAPDFHHSDCFAIEVGPADTS